MPESSANAFANSPNWSLWKARLVSVNWSSWRLVASMRRGCRWPKFKRRVGGQQVEVALAIGVGNPCPFAMCEDDGQRVVVVCAVALNEFTRIHARSLASGHPSASAPHALSQVLFEEAQLQFA